MLPWTTADLDAIARLGWVTEAPPITAEPALAADLGLDWLGIHRDDLLSSWYGGTKQRKLDYLLATEPFRDAPVWVSTGGIGSGQLAALTGAADVLKRRVVAICAWQPLADSVLENLAYTASGPSEILYFRNIAVAVLRHPGAFVGSRSGGRVVVPVGASHPVGLIGVVRAALILSARIRAGELPEPDVLVVARGSGGTAAGLALGLAMAGCGTRVLAVNVLPAVAGTRFALMRQVRACYRTILSGTDRDDPLPEIRLEVAYNQVGRGYGHATEAGVAAMGRVCVNAEPVYTGKALAALFARSAGWRGQRILYWHTQHRALPKKLENWRAKLPSSLQTDLVRSER